MKIYVRSERGEKIGTIKKKKTESMTSFGFPRTCRKGLKEQNRNEDTCVWSTESGDLLEKN